MLCAIDEYNGVAGAEAAGQGLARLQVYRGGCQRIWSI